MVPLVLPKQIGPKTMDIQIVDHSGEWICPGGFFMEQLFREMSTWYNLTLEMDKLVMNLVSAGF